MRPLSFCPHPAPAPAPAARLPAQPPATSLNPHSPFFNLETSSSDSFSYLRVRHIVLRAVAGALSFSLVALSLPVSFTWASDSLILYRSSEICHEEEAGAEQMAEAGLPPESVTNEGLVEEAWDVVNESFLPDAGSRPWSSEIWLEKKLYILDKRIQTRSKAHDIIRKMLSSLGDPYTRFLSPAEFSKMAKYDVSGVGVNLREVPDQNGSVKLKVIGIISDGPAHSAGVRQGDELLSVNGLDVRGKSAFDVSSMLQGPQETFVDIQFKRGNCGLIKSIKIQRQVVARVPVFYRLEKSADGVSLLGYIHIKEFNALAKKDLVTALKRLQESGASYFVLDLRGNLGGLVQAGIEIAKLFLDKGETVIYTAGKDQQVQRTITVETRPLITTPIIVLVNNKTASASEIVASALHDNCKAVLVGERTYGKGLIQSVFELSDGSGVVVTIGKYVTPNHKNINGNGIEPDFHQLPDLNQVINHLSQCQSYRMR